MGQQDDDKRRPQTPIGAAGTAPPATETAPPATETAPSATETAPSATETAPPARSPVRGPRTLTRKELESLRARLQKKFH
jgi:hypothetical protein